MGASSLSRPTVAVVATFDSQEHVGITSRRDPLRRILAISGHLPIAERELGVELSYDSMLRIEVRVRWARHGSTANNVWTRILKSYCLLDPIIATLSLARWRSDITSSRPQ